MRKYESLAHLQSGTDIRGKAYGENKELTSRAVKKIMMGYVEVLINKTGLYPYQMTVAVGHDTRLSSYRIRRNIFTILNHKGIKVIDCGTASTPGMYSAIENLKCTASIEITASHLPYDQNGLKFFTKDGGFEAEDIRRMIEIGEVMEIAHIKDNFTAEKIPCMKKYTNRLRYLTGKGVKNYIAPLSAYHIVVDAGNGVGGFFIRNVLEPLGADTSGSVCIVPDGTFPNHAPNPEDPEAMRSIREAVLAANADMGVIFDADVDRAACVDCHGRELNRNKLIAVAAAIVLKNNPGGTIVTDSVTSEGLTDFIENKLGGKHRRFKRGYKNVINEAKRLEAEGVNCPLAIETSGHAAFRDNGFIDDGAYLMALIINFVVTSEYGRDAFDMLLKDYKEPAEEKELRIKITAEDYKAYGEKVISDLEKYARDEQGWTIEEGYEGVRISFDKEHGDGWLLLRMSLHEPILPLNAESNSQGGTDLILEQFTEFVKGYDLLEMP